ncbi:hypothetical protein GCM10009117_01670 [Gangjinia marincola]|uniref:DNA polymerase III subunit gamma/tau n=1 Tax=Gangjinia marincola TaxID=578463 RepID=A0ABP3XTU9_9FLAO
MEHFVVSARKYRPQTFKDVVGQQAITNTLLNAIDNNHLAQALLFTGPRGVGKTTCARILAKKINLETHNNPDEDFAFNIFELDAASNNSVDDIRALTDQVRIPPQVGDYKVYIIDEVHMLSSSAFNAFLKTLEEPPKHAIFILATTEKHKIIPTILSRCQIFDFKRITVTDIKEYLKEISQKEGVEAEDDALHIIAQKADGAMRDALSIYDRVVSFSGKTLTRVAVAENLNVLDYDVFFTTTDLILNNDIPGLLVHFNEILAKGFDAHHYITGLGSHFRDLLVCQDEQTIPLLEVGEQTKLRYLEQAKNATRVTLLTLLDLANQCDLSYKSSKNQRLLIELCLMKLASVTFDGEKKNDIPFIIPSKQFLVKGIKVNLPKRNSQTQLEEEGKHEPEHKVSIQGATETVVSSKPLEIASALANDVKTTQATPMKLNVGVKKPLSGLSLKSIQQKKQLEAAKKANQKIDVQLNETFTEEQLLSSWREFVDLTKRKGEKILASILETDTPILKNTTEVHLALPNHTMRLELEKSQGDLMQYIRQKLQNTSLSLHIHVNEEVATKYAFTPREKYDKLVEKNPLVDELRKTFDLDI